MNRYHGAKTKVIVESELNGRVLRQVGVHQGSVLSLVIFKSAAGVITELVGEARRTKFGEQMNSFQ